MKTNVLNYKIMNFNNKKKICYVFFSGNGIINNNKTLNDVIDKDYYEFSNVAKSEKIINSVSKIIFFRDLELNFYVNGVNDNINSIDDVIDFLSKETNGLDVVVVGYSAGGYLATICGIKMNNVKRVYSFGCVYNLYSWQGSHLEASFLSNKDLIANQTNAKKEKYYNLIPFMASKKLKTDFYHFYGNKSESDLRVLEELKTHNISRCFHFISLDSTKHGGNLSYYDYLGLFIKPINVPLSFKKAEYSKIAISIKLQGGLRFLFNTFNELRYRMRVKQ